MSVGRGNGGYNGRGPDGVQRLPAPVPVLLRLLEAVQRHREEEGELAAQSTDPTQVHRRGQGYTLQKRPKPVYGIFVLSS